MTVGLTVRAPMASKGKTTNRTLKLAALAAPLAAARAPFYVRRRDLTLGLQRHFPADGWYWTPAGSPVAVWLAQTFDEAAYILRRQVERQEQDEEREAS